MLLHSLIPKTLKIQQAIFYPCQYKSIILTSNLVKLKVNCNLSDHSEEAWKNIWALTGFEPHGATPTKLKSHMLGAGHML